MEYSDELKTKVQLYFAANFLYGQGKSHPEVVKMLCEMVPNPTLVQTIADQAMTDEWRKVFHLAQTRMAEQQIYADILDEVRPMLDDPEVVRFIVDSWYAVETFYMENYIESEGNIREGSKQAVLFGLGMAALIYWKASIYIIISWGIAMVVGLLVWLFGLWQKRTSANVEKILREDFNLFKDTI